MTYQPKDVSDFMYDENNFKTLDTVISLRDDTQTTTSNPDIDPSKYSPSRSDELSVKNIGNESIDEIFDSWTSPTLASTYHHNAQSFPECQFDESHLLDPFEDPINEITITTSTSDLKNDNNHNIINNIQSELNLTSDEIENFFKTVDELSLQSIDDSIEQRTMSIEIQPPANLRPRYKSDGTRQIEKSRTKPMVVKLPNLKDVNLDSNQVFVLRLILTTYSKNPSDQTYFHVNKLEYHSNDSQELNDGTVCVLLTSDDIKEGKKSLPRLSIVKTKLETYKPELTPLNLSGNHENLNKAENEKLSVKQAKDIFKQFNMKDSQITCQLLIKQNQSVHFTDIKCETYVIKEKGQKNSTNKRSTTEIDSDEEEESFDERPSTSKSKSSNEQNVLIVK